MEIKKKKGGVVEEKYIQTALKKQQLMRFLTL